MSKSDGEVWAEEETARESKGVDQVDMDAPDWRGWGCNVR